MSNNLNTGKLFKQLKEINQDDYLKVFYGKHKNPYILSLFGLDISLGLPEVRDRITNLEDNVYKITYYEIIDLSASTTGSITIPEEAEVFTSGFDGNAVLSTLNANDYPAGETPEDGGNPITANLDISGNWTASGTYTGGNVALIYQLTIESEFFDNLNTNQIVDFYLVSKDRYDNHIRVSEQFTANGVDTIFTLDGSWTNATLQNGTFDVDNIIIGGDIHITTLTFGALYTGTGATYIEDRTRIEAIGFNPITGAVTLSSPPQQDFKIFYLYKLGDSDDVGDTLINFDYVNRVEADELITRFRLNLRPEPIINTVAPTVNDDNTLGYQVGQIWVHNNDTYICTDDSAGAAVWTNTSGDKTFTFTQGVPAITWGPINHGLNKFPSITVEDSAGSVVYGAEQYIDLNNVIINFSAPFSGKAHFN
jgi:hypothetical protein